MEDTPQPNIRLFRKKRFWFRWAVPGLLLALWVEGMLFEGAIVVNHWRTSPITSYSLGIGHGVVSMEAHQTRYGLDSNGWNSWGSGLDWDLGLEMLPRFFVNGYFTSNLEEYLCRISIPLWSPLILWLLIIHLWSRHQKRKHATLQIRPEIHSP